ncbi:uncharacterized protein LOC143020347 isoform X2 [Oratosquilla oratoria]
MSLRKDRMHRRGSIFSTFLLCCLSASLMVAAVATPFWFSADVRNIDDPTASGSVNLGLFDGIRTLVMIVNQKISLHVVCENSTCMYSCGTTNEYRLDDLRSFVEGNPDDFDTLGKCSINEEKTSAFGRSSADEVSLIQRGFPSAVREGYSLGAAPLGDAVRLSESLRESFLQRNFPQEEHESDVEDDTTVAPTIGGDAGFAFMDYGLWVATIASLAAGMLFAVVGALFAVINTATTPVEAITGVPGLYVWNTLAAVFNLVCVICWAVQFHTRLTKNVLVRDSLNGWTTEGQEIFGYSYW